MLRALMGRPNSCAKGIIRTLSICILLLSIIATAAAVNPGRSIYQLAHRSWGEKEGYPGRTQALAQTRDGFIWMGSGIGLFRFDGVHFERYVARSGDKLPETMVRSVLALPDDTLWIAYGYATEICALRDGNAKCYGGTEGVTSMPNSVVQDHQGTLWANTQTGVIRFNGVQWQHIGKDWNFPEDVPHITSNALFVDSRGTLWVGVNHTVLYLKQNSKRFEPTGVFAGWSQSFAEAPDGTLWMADNEGYVRAISMSVSSISAAAARCEVETPKGMSPKCPSDDSQVIKISTANDILFDRNGSLWMGTDTSGLARIQHPGGPKDSSPSEAGNVLQTFSSKDGLTADNCLPILEDREGNIWVATRDGLDQFRDTALVSVPLPTSLVQIGIAPADDGDIWASGTWNFIARVYGDSRNVSLVPADAFKPYRDHTGVTWLFGDSLWQWKDGSFRRVAKSPDGRTASFGAWDAAEDKFGTLWAFSEGYGLFSLDHHQWRAWTTPPEVAKQRSTDVFSDSMGRVWISTYQGDIITVDKGKIEDYPIRLAIPNSTLHYVKAFAEYAPQKIWAGGEGGLALIDNGRFRLIKPATGNSFQDVTGIVDTGAGGLWLNTNNGIIHISRAEAEHALSDASYHFHCQRFDISDGLPGQTDTIGPYPKAIQGTDGRIWFTATGGIAWIDPTQIPKNTIPPPVSITSISADGSDHIQFADLRFPAHTTDVQIIYTALSLSAPERVRFKYKLDGIDTVWQDPGTRREAYYSRLPPGGYSFHVIACNNDGVWNETGATLDFRVLPAWYQTTWFRIVCVTLLLALLWALYQLRLRQLERQFQVALEARVNERTRIARELHDTLLQSFNGLLLRFQTVSNLLPARPEEAKRRIDGVIEEGSNAITEGRDAVHELRSMGLPTVDLAQSVRKLAKELLSHPASETSLEVRVEGTPRDLIPVVRDEAYRIAAEALRNAIRHAAAQRIEVEIRYDQEHLQIRIRDDGRGIDADVIEKEHAPGHWGLRGMRERVKLIGGSFEIWSKPGSGTEIELKVPAQKAYTKFFASRWSIFSRISRR